jgi:DNA-binding NarL/FixJ family response regulator
VSELPQGELSVGVISADSLARSGLRGLLGDFPEVRVVHEAATMVGVPFGVDLAVVDIGQFEGGAVAEFALDQPVLVLVADANSARSAIEGGATGALLRDGDSGRLRSALHAVVAGLVVVDDAFAAELFDGQRGRQEELEEPLTPREQEVLMLIADGLSNREIGAQLGIAERTAKFHVASLNAKLEVRSRAEAVARAVRIGLLRL